MTDLVPLELCGEAGGQPPENSIDVPCAHSVSKKMVNHIQIMQHTINCINKINWDCFSDLKDFQMNQTYTRFELHVIENSLTYKVLRPLKSSL